MTGSNRYLKNTFKCPSCKESPAPQMNTSPLPIGKKVSPLLHQRSARRTWGGFTRLFTYPTRLWENTAPNLTSSKNTHFTPNSPAINRLVIFNLWGRIFVNNLMLNSTPGVVTFATFVGY